MDIITEKKVDINTAITVAINMVISEVGIVAINMAIIMVISTTIANISVIMGSTIKAITAGIMVDIMADTMAIIAVALGRPVQLFWALA